MADMKPPCEICNRARIAVKAKIRYAIETTQHEYILTSCESCLSDVQKAVDDLQNRTGGAVGFVPALVSSMRAAWERHELGHIS